MNKNKDLTKYTWKINGKSYRWPDEYKFPERRRGTIEGLEKLGSQNVNVALGYVMVIIIASLYLLGFIILGLTIP